jgi:hypothetical protein
VAGQLTERATVMKKTDRDCGSRQLTAIHRGTRSSSRFTFVNDHSPRMGSLVQGIDSPGARRSRMVSRMKWRSCFVSIAVTPLPRPAQLAMARGRQLAPAYVVKDYGCGPQPCKAHLGRDWIVEVEAAVIDGAHDGLHDVESERDFLAPGLFEPEPENSQPLFAQWSSSVH